MRSRYPKNRYTPLDPNRPLSPRARLFIDKYLEMNEGKGAVIAAGYAAKNADKIASQLLGDTRIIAILEQKRAEIAKKTAEKLEITAEKITAELAAIAFSNVGDYLDLSPDGAARLNLGKATRSQLGALGGVQIDEGERVKVKIKMRDKTEALIRLGQELGLFKNRVEATGKDGAPLVPAAPADDLDVARRILFALDRAQRQLEEKEKKDG